MIIRACYWFFS